MGEYFRGWRRKIGVVTLVIACFFMVGWLRSLTFNESVVIQFREDWTDELASNDSSLIWECQRPWRGSGLLPEFYSNRRSGDDNVWERPFVEWRWQFLGFRYGGDVGGAKVIGNMILHTSPSTVTVVPYLSIVLPLTAASFWLLLSKPRKSPSEKITQPIQVEGAAS